MMGLKPMRARRFVPLVRPASNRLCEAAVTTRPEAASENRSNRRRGFECFILSRRAPAWRTAMLKNRQRGFGLIELLIAMVVLTVGLLAMAVLIMYGIRIQTFARDATLASGVAKQRLEILRNIPRTNAVRQDGGSLDANVAPYFVPVDLDPNNGVDPDTPFVVRWMLAAGPAGTQNVTVRVVSTSPARQLPPIQFQSQIP